MNDTSRPISIDFSDITIIGGKHAWMHSTSCGISLTGHEHPHENVRGLLRMRNVSISETPAAGLRLTSKAAVGSMWRVELDGLRLDNVATSWPMPAVATTKDPYPCATVSYRMLHDPSLSIDLPSFSLFFWLVVAVLILPPWVQNAAPIVIGWFSRDVHFPWVPACFKNGPCTQNIPIEPVGGMFIRNATIIDAHNRPFVSCGSPRFPNGTQFIDHLPDVVQNFSFAGVVEHAGSPTANASVVCRGDLGPVKPTEFGPGYAQRKIFLDVDCHVH